MACNHEPKHANGLCRPCYSKQWYQEHKLKEKQRGAQYYVVHKSECKKRHKQWRKKNKDKLATYYRNRTQTNPKYRIELGLRNRLNCALKNKQKAGSAIRDLGCSIEDLMIYLESKFHPHPITGQSMTWDNQGEWEIDHIVELDTFDLTQRAAFLKACHYTNLQPLWTEEHLIKTAEYLKTKIFKKQ